MFSKTLIIATLAVCTPVLAAPVWAEDHGDHDHGDHIHTSDVMAGPQAPDNDDIQAALDAGGSLVMADILGVVCDFCATAMDKTFSRRDEVAAVYVDLDTKALSLVIKPGMSLDDDTIENLVLQAGYKLAAIHRNIPAEASDAS